MAHPDEVVKVEHEKDSEAVAVAQARHEQAESDPAATAQEKKQAAVEKAHALSTRPQGSYAQLHETAEATLAVPGDKAKDAKEAVEEGIEVRDSDAPTEGDKAAGLTGDARKAADADAGGPPAGDAGKSSKASK
jgi:hypothetical protein